jgi:hypothetical protein
VADDAQRSIDLVLKENVTLFSRALRKSRDWSVQDLAEFYRVESALIQGGMRVVTDRGLSDEGDPWFVFCRAQDGEPIAHFARIDGQYIIASPAYEGVTRGLDFRVMVQELIERHKLSLINNDRDKKSNIHIHPAALLIILVGAAFFKTPSQANADELKKESGHGQRGEGPSTGSSLRFSPTMDNGVWSAANAEQVQKDQALVRHLWLVASAASLVTTTDESASHPVVPDAPDQPLLDVFFEVHTNSRVASQNRADAQEWTVSNISFVAPPKTDNGSEYNTWLDRGVLSASGSGETPASHTSFADLSVFSVGASALAVVSASTNKLNFSILSNEFVSLYTMMSKGFTSPHATISSLNAPASSSAEASKTDFSAKSQTESLHVGYYEAPYVVGQSSAAVKNITPLGIVPQQTGSALNFLNDNNIFVTAGVESNLSVKSGFLAQADNSSQLIVEDSKTSAVTLTPSVDDATQHLPNTSTLETLSSSEFVKVLGEFLQEAQDVHVTVSHGYYVFEDASISHGWDSHKDSITMTFDDGSAISIVGQPQVLHDLVSQVVYT